MPVQVGELRDSRTFGLYDVRHGHSYALIRGFPPEPDDDEPVGTVVLDIMFSWVERVCCRRQFSPLHLRITTDPERAALEDRLGPFRPRNKVFLLEYGTIEAYVVAHEVQWAEFDVGGGGLSPFSDEYGDYADQHPPLGGYGRLLAL
jgi:hypothetical protein